MRRIFISFAISIILFATSSTTVYASCYIVQPVSKYAEKADIIVVGVPISRLSSYYIFQVDKYYKGSGPMQIKVRDPSFEDPGVVTSTALTSTLSLQERHLIYLNKVENDIYKNSACNGSRHLKDKQIPSEKEVLGDYSFFHQLSLYQSSLKLGGAILLAIVLGVLTIKIITR